jgi:hypothetical protein
MVWVPPLLVTVMVEVQAVSPSLKVSFSVTVMPVSPAATVALSRCGVDPPPEGGVREMVV